MVCFVFFVRGFNIENSGKCKRVEYFPYLLYVCIFCVFIVVFLQSHICSLWDFTTGFNPFIFIVGFEGQIPASA